MACSAHVEKGDVVAVSVGVEQPALDGGWGIGITRGTILQGFVDGVVIYIPFKFTFCSLAQHFNSLFSAQLQFQLQFFLGGFTSLSNQGFHEIL